MNDDRRIILLDGSNHAPAFVGRAPNPDRSSEFVKVEFEQILPDGAGAELEVYPTRDGMRARRYWALPRVLLVGGDIRDHSDAMHLARDFGVTHVLAFVSEACDDGRWSQKNRAQVPFEDNGRDPSLHLMERTVKWVKDLPRDGVVLYCHDWTGDCRGPCAAYLALRVRWYMTRQVAQKYAGRRPDGSQLLYPYLRTIDRAVLNVCGRP